MGSTGPGSHERQRERRTALQARLAAADLGGMLVTQPANVRYLSGFTGSFGALLLVDGRAVFVTDGRYRQQASAEVADAELVLSPGDLMGGVITVMAATGGGLGFEPAGLTWEDGQRLRRGLPGRPVLPAPPLVEELRAVKDGDELHHIAAAAAIGTAAFGEILGTLREGVTERDVALDLEVRMRRLGAGSVAFPSIVAFGEQAAEPHHRPGDRALRRGDLVKLDFGAEVGGYRSDMTRTVVLGPASDRQRELHELVRRSQAAGLAALRAGVSGGAVDRACRQVIEEAGLGTAFAHSTGHGIGLEVHEAPRARAGDDGTIAAGTPVTVEPGVYLPGFGGVRIEDLAVVRDHGHDVLTTAPRELLEL